VLLLISIPVTSGPIGGKGEAKVIVPVAPGKLNWMLFAIPEVLI
jgi:hypothetical protein